VTSSPRLTLRMPEVRTALSRHRVLLAAGLAAGSVATSLSVLAPKAEAGVQVVSASHDLVAGTALAAGDLRVVALPRTALPAGAVVTPTEVLGRVLAAPLRRGELLTDVRLAGAALLAPGSDGQVAVPVRVADADAALVTAGDRVDVLAAAATAGGPPFAQVVAADAEVLAVPTAVQDGGEGALIVVATSPGVASRLAAAAVSSRLSITLRPR
jgi:Flp pilus assembly protein CpaB